VTSTEADTHLDHAPHADAQTTPFRRLMAMLRPYLSRLLLAVLMLGALSLVNMALPAFIALL